MAYTLPVINDLIGETCCSCSVRFAMTKTLQSLRRGDGELFYCPNGHPQSYKETEEDRLRKRIATADENAGRYKDSWRDEQKCCERLERSRIALRGQITRLKRG